MTPSMYVLTRAVTRANESVQCINGIVEGRRAACERALADLQEAFHSEAAYGTEMFHDDLLTARIVLDKYMENKGTKEVSIGFRCMGSTEAIMVQIQIAEVPVLK